MVDFAKLNQEMQAERARQAALSPEQRAAEEAERAAARRARAEAEEDARLFGDRALRTERLHVQEFGGMGPDGGRRFHATNAKGPVKLVLPEDRHDETRRGAQQAAGHAFDQAFGAAQDRGDGLGLPVEATGLFRSYTWKDRDGAQRKAWEFVATKISFVHEGVQHTIGREVRRPEPVEQAKAGIDAGANMARGDRGEAR